MKDVKIKKVKIEGHLITIKTKTTELLLIISDFIKEKINRILFDELNNFINVFTNSTTYYMNIQEFMNEAENIKESDYESDYIIFKPMN